MYQSNIYQYLLDKPLADKPLLIVAKDDKEAMSVRDVGSVLGYTVYTLPDIRVSVGEDLRAYQEEIYALLSTLGEYYKSSEKTLLVAPLRTMLLPLPKVEFFQTQRIEFGDTIKLGVFKEELYHWGYHFVDIASQKGEVSFRGDIIDIFPINCEKPYRITLFDEEVESIRNYDENTQKSLPEELEELHIIPTYLALESKQYEA